MHWHWKAFFAGELVLFDTCGSVEHGGIVGSTLRVQHVPRPNDLLVLRMTGLVTYQYIENGGEWAQPCLEMEDRLGHLTCFCCESKQCPADSRSFSALAESSIYMEKQAAHAAGCAWTTWVGPSLAAWNQ